LPALLIEESTSNRIGQSDIAQRLLKSAKIERVDLLMPTDSRMLQAQPAAGRSGVGSPARASLLPTLLPRNAVG